MLEAGLAALEAFGKASGVARSAHVYALVSASHIVGIGMLFGAVAAIDLRLLGFARGLGPEALATLRRFARAGLLLALLTGALLASAKPFEYAGNPFMLWKLAVLALAVANALAFERMVARRGMEAMVDSPSARLFGLASLALWLAAIWLGRMIAFA